MGSAGTGRLVSLSLDPVLMPAGFQGGQYGDDGGGATQIIFCAPHDEFSRRHSGLPQANRQEQAGTCVDLVVEVGVDGALGRLDLEGISLEETLSYAGLFADAKAVAQLNGGSMAQSLPVLQDALRRLFGETG